MKIFTKIVTTVSAFALTSAAFAQSAPQSPLQVLNSYKDGFLADTTSLLGAGTGMLIGAILIAALFGLVIRFFRKG